MPVTDYFSKQVIRDLKWIFSSTPLIQTEKLSFEQKPLCADWISDITKSVNVIEQFMATKNLKMLGPYFEALWEFYLTYYPDKKLIAKNLQVFDNNKTIGEFDFIYFDKVTRDYHHLEVAVKYFLGNYCDSTSHDNESTQSLMSDWLGPNVNDRLDKKYQKMKQHQSQLSQHPAGKRVLRELGIEKIKSQTCLLGSLFYPFTEDCDSANAMRPPENCHPEHSRERWVKLSRVDECLATAPLWCMLEKPHWMGKLVKSVSELDSPQDIFNKIQHHFLQTSRPLLVTNFKQDRQLESEFLYSSDKYFVVPDCWPSKY